MKCPICGAWSSVLETRESSYETTRRRRECANRHRFWTYEVHESMRHPASMKRSIASIQRRRKMWERDQRIAKDPRPTSVVAAVYGLVPRHILNIRKRNKP